MWIFFSLLTEIPKKYLDYGARKFVHKTSACYIRGVGAPHYQILLPIFIERSRIKMSSFINVSKCYFIIKINKSYLPL
jgi:hypothetical protein